MKCAINHCPNHVGPIRARESKLCYQCDSNIAAWEDRGVTRMLRWQQKVRKFAERMALVRNKQPAAKVRAFVRKEAEKRAD